MWLVYNLIGAISLALVNSFFKANPWSLSTWGMITMMIIPTFLFTQGGFAHAYRLAPSFMAAWFSGSAFSAICGLLCSLYFFGKQIEAVNSIGIILILSGTWMLICK